MASKVSLKEIVKSIEEALHKLDEPTTETRSPYAKNERERARKMLKGVKDTVEAICLPGFDVPEA
jgi:hypothetical protein